MNNYMILNKDVLCTISIYRTNIFVAFLNVLF